MVSDAVQDAAQVFHDAGLETWRGSSTSGDFAAADPTGADALRRRRDA